MYRVYLLLGSNMGDRKAVIEQATRELIDALLPDYLEIGSLDEAVNTSQMYETEPWGFESPDKFMNQAFCCVTELEPQQVLSECLRIEKELGRVRNSEQYGADGKRIYSSRVIDIDILLIDKQEFVVSAINDAEAGKDKRGEKIGNGMKGEKRKNGKPGESGEKCPQQRWVEVTVNTSDLIIPHPRLHEREFALKPLRELRRTI
ncbi:MAG: 2-amino-4-hydroxy-6-hydroxymethyldihydropteridine diphosphokinase [Bacteroidales bacterium]